MPRHSEPGRRRERARPIEGHDGAERAGEIDLVALTTSEVDHDFGNKTNAIKRPKDELSAPEPPEAMSVPAPPDDDVLVLGRH